MKKTAVKLILLFAKHLALRFIVSFIMLFFMSLLVMVKPDYHQRMGNWLDDAKKIDTVEVSVTINRDGTALVEENVTYPGDSTVYSTKAKSYSLVQTLRDGNLAFEYDYAMQRSTANSVCVKIRMKGENLSRVTQWSGADGFHGAAGFRGGDYVAFTTRGMRETDKIKIKLLLSGDCFEDINYHIGRYFSQPDSWYETESEQFSSIYRGAIDETPESLTMHYIRQVAKYLLFPLLIALIMMFVVPLNSKEQVMDVDDKDIPARLEYIKGMRRYTQAILLCEALLTAAIVINPFELRFKWAILIVFYTLMPALILLSGTLDALSTCRKLRKEAVAPTKAVAPEIAATESAPINSAGRILSTRQQVNHSRGGNIVTYFATCEEKYYALYKCPHCGKVNQQLLSSVIDVGSGSESAAKKRLGKFVPSVSEKLLSNEGGDYALYKRANLRTRCLNCDKAPFWAFYKPVERNFNAAMVCWLLFTAAILVCLIAKKEMDFKPAFVLASLAASPAIGLVKLYEMVKYRILYRTAEQPALPIFAGSLQALNEAKESVLAFRELKLRETEDKYGDKWEKHSGYSGVILESMDTESRK